MRGLKYGLSFHSHLREVKKINNIEHITKATRVPGNSGIKVNSALETVPIAVIQPGKDNLRLTICCWGMLASDVLLLLFALARDMANIRISFHTD